MPVSLEKEPSLARIIEEHLELKRRNSRLDPSARIDGYREDPLESNHLFGSVEQARFKDALSGKESERHLEPSKLLISPGEQGKPEALADPDDALWGKYRDFDWGD
jgi:hypothetical protein